jgi:FixJ family two-component response regulator
LPALTTREHEVVDMLVAGKINKVIGAELGISTRTVESHRARIMRKLGVDSLPDIFKLVFAAEGEEEKQF